MTPTPRHRDATKSTSRRNIIPPPSDERATKVHLWRHDGNAGRPRSAPAQAYYLKNTDFGNFHSFLRFPPRHPSFRPCISNTVTLPRGDYFHGAYIVSQSHRTNPDLENETLRVRARTTYNWEVCRGWNDDIGRGRYQVRSRLVRRGFSHSALMTFENEIGGRSFLYGNGKYEWGGRIARACFDCTSPSG